MASTYSNLKIELIGTGDQTGSWGLTTNTNLGTAIEEAIVGSADVTFASGDVTITLTDTNATQTARNLRLNLTGTSGGARNLILGSGCQIEKPYLINNGLADAVTVKNTTGTGITVPAGKSMWVYNDGTNVVDAVTHLSSLTLGAALPIASGGTNSAATPTAGGVAYGTGTAYAVTSAGIAGQVLQSNGSSAPSWVNASTGTVTAVSVATANGFAGTSSGGATPALTLTTSISGVLKGNGTAISAAVSGTDYVAPGGALSTPSSGILSNCTVDGTNSVGFRNIPQNIQSANYTLVLADSGKHIYRGSGTAATWTIPANSSVAYPIGTALTFINLSATSVNIAITSDTMYLSSAGTTGTRTLAQFGSATAIKVASTFWLISGSGLT